MKLFKKPPADDWLVKFLKEKGGFGQEIDHDQFLRRIEAVGALVALKEFLQNAEANDVMLPPGYWEYLYRLKRELEQDEAHE